MQNPAGLEISELRKRVRSAIEKSRRTAAERRVKLDAAAVAYAEFLERLANPLVHMLAHALRAEGYQFTVFTPAGGLRLASAKSGEDFIEFALDAIPPEPQIVLRVNRARGRRVMQHERPVAERVAIERVTQEDVLAALLEELTPFVER